MASSASMTPARNGSGQFADFWVHCEIRNVFGADTASKALDPAIIRDYHEIKPGVKSMLRRWLIELLTRAKYGSSRGRCGTAYLMSMPRSTDQDSVRPIISLVGSTSARADAGPGTPEKA